MEKYNVIGAFSSERLQNYLTCICFRTNVVAFPTQKKICVIRERPFDLYGVGMKIFRKRNPRPKFS